MSTECSVTGKIKLIKRTAVMMVRNHYELHHYYKCDKCGAYHVSSRDVRYKK